MGEKGEILEPCKVVGADNGDEAASEESAENAAGESLKGAFNRKGCADVFHVCAHELHNGNVILPGEDGDADDVEDGEDGCQNQYYGNEGDEEGYRGRDGFQFGEKEVRGVDAFYNAVGF